MSTYSSQMGAVGGAGALGGAGDAFATLLPPELPELFPRLLKPLDGRFEKFYRVLTFDDDTEFKCIGIGGFGAVFDVRPEAAAYEDGRITEAIPPKAVLAMKQVYLDRELAEKVWKREVELLFDYRYRILADRDARATICVPVDGFKYSVDPSMKTLLRIVMFRSPVATPFKYTHRAAPGKSLPPHEEPHAESDFEFSAGSDMMANPYAVPGRMTPAQVHYVMRQLLTALAFMHAHELIHRDVKTSNVLVWGKVGDPAFIDGSEPLEPIVAAEKSEPLPWVKLGDFGLARAVTFGMTKDTGTKAFIAPEVRGEDGYSNKADIFSAGCVLYHLITGKAPLEPDEAAAAAASEEAAAGKLFGRFPCLGRADCALRDGADSRLPFARFRRAFAAMVHPSASLRPDAARLLESADYFGAPARV